MAGDKPINSLRSASVLQDGDTLVVFQDSETKKMAGSVLRTYVENSAQPSVAAAAASAQAAEDSADTAEENALKAEGYAVGRQNGVPAGSGQPYYQDNAAYYAVFAMQSMNQAGRSAADAELWAKGSHTGGETPSDTNNSKYWAEQAGTSAGAADSAAAAAAASAQAAADSAEDATAAARTLTIDATLTQAGQAADAKAAGDKITALTTRVTAIEEAEGLHRYGVSGIGQSASALTRLWDAVGMTAQVGTDGDNSNVINNFDDVTPFNRRKCVGDWRMSGGHPVFHVHAYLGDENYAEDGSAGDYVAVECPRAYYYLHNGVLGVSAHQYPGWRPFDIFCRNHDPEDTIPYAYLPAYALALKDGKAVSLPGLDNVQGSYKDIMDACRTYADADAGAVAFCQPMAVNFYEWALFTVEFAQQNCQNIMYGCGSLRHNADDRATLRADGKWLLNNYSAARVAGEYVSIQPSNADINSSTYYASHKILSITRCDADGNESSSGAYQLIETQDLGTGREYTVGTGYQIAARPYRTGSCNGVSTPSGSPVSNTNGYYPMKYRWRENEYGNQAHTVSDLFNKRVGTGDDDYYLEWYFLPDPAHYTPSTTGKPDATDLASDAFILLDVETTHENYKNGYIKSKQYSEEYPDLWIPHAIGGSASTYYADYATLVYSYVVRAVRLGGHWYYGAYDGLSYLTGYHAPSSAYAFSGGDLFFPQ